MSNSFSFPASLTVDLTAQGQSFTVTPADFSPSAIEAIFTYGVRRWFQDSLNAQAAQARNAGIDITEAWVKDSFNQRLEQAVSGVTVRKSAATAADPLDPYRISVLRGLMKAQPNGPLAKAYKAIPSDDQPARQAYLLDVAGKNAAKIDPLALEAKQKAEDEARAAANAAEALEL